LEHIDFFRAPALVRPVGAMAGPEARHLDEVETRAVFSCHGQDGAAVTLEPGQPLFLQGSPLCAWSFIQPDLVAPGGAAPRRQCRLVDELPGEGVLVTFCGGFGRKRELWQQAADED